MTAVELQHELGIDAQPVLSSLDVVAGLGAAPRELLAASLALYDDGSLQARIASLWKKWKPGQAVEHDDAVETARSVQDSAGKWLCSSLTDDDLRLLLWVRLRESFELPAMCFASMRAAGTAADDLVARTLQSLQPGRVAGWLESQGWKEAKARPQTLDMMARATLQEIVDAMLNADDAQSAQVREHLLEEVRGKLDGLDDDARRKVLDAVGADELNDAALRRILLTGGGLGAFGAGVSVAGFSAYILAAQLSAFIPFVSGPALVSLVSVLSNPVTIVAGTVGVAWWVSTSANADIRMAISARVMSLLALSGTLAGYAGVRLMLTAFPRIESLRTPEGFAAGALMRYKADWKVIAPVRRAAVSPDADVMAWMESVTGESRLCGVVSGKVDEIRNAGLLGVMTLGDILYNAWRIDPHVLEAADFSRVRDLGDPVALAGFAREVHALGEAGMQGAVSNLKGYVAERVVASQLVAQGYVVEFPDDPNEAGWDIAVDGVQYQVKNVQSLFALQEHFDRYGYEYPVIANSEIAEQLAAKGDDAPEWASHVHFVEGYSNELVEHVTRDSLDAGMDMLEPDVPALAVLLSSLCNYRRASRGEITGSQAVQEVLLDGGTRAGLAVVGGYVGSGVGLLVFGPAGALVFGAVTPVLSQMQAGRIKGQLDKLLTSKVYKVWEADAKQALDRLAGTLEDSLKRKAELLKRSAPMDRDGVVGVYLDWRHEEEVRGLREAWCRLNAIRKSGESMEVRARISMQWLGGGAVFPAEYQEELLALANIFKVRPTVGERIAEQTGEAVVTTREKLEKLVGYTRRLWNSTAE